MLKSYEKEFGMGLGMGKKGLGQFNYPYEKVFGEAENALKDAGFKVKNTDKGKGVIEASASMSWKSWGEKIIVTIRKSGGREGAEVEIESKEKAQLIDYGKGSENIRKFFEALKKRLP